ncbi:MAG TPA: hypothetical protein VI039_12445 [Solirubrobacterales bacterium]
MSPVVVRDVRWRGFLAAVLLLAVLAVGLTGFAYGERSQRGNLIVSLDGELSPLKLPRDRAAPVSVRLDGGLQTADRTTLPRVTRVELGLPSEATLSTRGLPICRQQRLRNATAAEALSACRPALVGRGWIETQVVLPNQPPFAVRTHLLAFNGRVGGRRAVVMHASAVDPPTVAVIPFVIRRGEGRFGTALVANLSPALGPWPRFARFEVTLARRYSYRGKSRSYVSASCPIPRRFTAGFFSFAKATFKLANGKEISTGIARSCRAR